MNLENPNKYCFNSYGSYASTAMHYIFKRQFKTFLLELIGKYFSNVAGIHCTSFVQSRYVIVSLQRGSRFKKIIIKLLSKRFIIVAMT